MSDKLKSSSPRRGLLVTAAALLLLTVTSLLFTSCSGGGKGESKAGAESKAETKGKGEHGDEHGEGEAEEVELSEEALKAAKIETAEVSEQAASETLRVTGSVETNQQQTQQATPLVSGRVERVNVALGDRVRAGQPLAVIASPQIAQMHGKLHEAETKLSLAERELQRVERAENRAAVLSAKAKLDEAEASLNRTRRLIELGAGAGKDLVAAETAYRTAKAEYDFQSNIALNKEIQEARAEVETARVDVAHIRDEMKSLGAPVSKDEHRQHGDDHQRDTSLIVLRAPVSGTVTERLVNAGAGIEAGKPLFTVANIANLWVIANVPEAQVRRLRVGTSAQVRAAGGEEAITGRVTYIDPTLNEETRTARVRVELTNPGGRLRVGTFVEVSFRTGAAGGELALTIPDEAVQRIGERTVVFLPKAEAAHDEEKEENKGAAKDEKKEKVAKFEVREVEVGGVADGMRQVTGGLKAGERVVTKGSFTLKTQLNKGELGEDDH
jgi:membrane fusion protein, heavy metal efflux system